MNKAVFLDRDGTINVEKHYLYKIEEFEYQEGAIQALKSLQDSGYKLIIITNQSGIARGFYTEADFGRLNQWMIKDLDSRDVHIEKVYYCPHYPEGKISRYAQKCDCRKPGTELFWKAQKELHIDMTKSYAIGDKMRDLTICNESDVQGILLGHLKETNLPDQMSMLSEPDKIWSCKNLLDASDWIIKHKVREGKTNDND